MYVENILRQKGTEVYTVSPETTIRELARELVEHRIGAAVVVDAEGVVVGVISERDVVHCIAERGGGCLKRKVVELMTAKVITCAPETTIDKIMNQMTERHIRHLPVIDDGRLAGIVSIGDVVKSRIASAEHEISLLRSYVSGWIG
jgi:CBS domain-containing protein